MANLDTENKRRSATGIFHIYTIPMVPDGEISNYDREHITYLYAGIAPSIPEVVEEEAVFLLVGGGPYGIWKTMFYGNAQGRYGIKRNKKGNIYIAS